MVGLQSSDSLSPWEREQIVGNHNNSWISVIWSLSPWERDRERVKAVNPTWSSPFGTTGSRRVCFANKNMKSHTVRHHFCKHYPWAKPTLRFCIKPMLLSDDLSHKKVVWNPQACLTALSDTGRTYRLVQRAGFGGRSPYRSFQDWSLWTTADKSLWP